MAFGDACPHEGCNGTVKIERCNGPECGENLESCVKCCYVSGCSCGDSEENTSFWVEDKTEGTTWERLCAGCDECTERFREEYQPDDDPNY